MQVIHPSYELLTDVENTRGSIVNGLESIGRVCYKSEDRITDTSSSLFVDKITHRLKHHSVLEHYSISVRFICNRGFTHELVRHRLASYSQESTRYVNYSNRRFGCSITCIKPAWFEEGSAQYERWLGAMRNAERSYMELISNGARPQEARGVLPIDVKTEIVTTANLREWRHIFDLRCSSQAHPSMRELMVPLRDELRILLPEVFS